MISVEFVEQKPESEDISSFTFEIRALPDPEQRAQQICEKITNNLLDNYGSNERFAADVSVLGANGARQTLVIEVRIKDENIPSAALSNFISNSINKLS